MNQLGKKLKIRPSTSSTSAGTSKTILQIIDNHKIPTPTNKIQGIKRGNINRTTITKTSSIMVLLEVKMFTIRHMILKMAKIVQITIDSILMISIADWLIPQICREKIRLASKDLWIRLMDRNWTKIRLTNSLPKTNGKKWRDPQGTITQAEVAITISKTNKIIISFRKSKMWEVLCQQGPNLKWTCRRRVRIR